MESPGRAGANTCNVCPRSPCAGRRRESRLVVMNAALKRTTEQPVAYFLAFFARLVLLAREVLAITAFLAVRLRAAFLAGFFAAFLVAMVRLSSSSVGSGCPVNACRNASHRRSLFVACRRLDT